LFVWLIKQHGMNIYGELRYNDIFITLALDRSEWSPPRQCHASAMKLWSWVGPRAGLDNERRKYLAPAGNRTLSFQSPTSLHRLNYTSFSKIHMTVPTIVYTCRQSQLNIYCSWTESNPVLPACNLATETQLYELLQYTYDCTYNCIYVPYIATEYLLLLKVIEPCPSSLQPRYTSSTIRASSTYIGLYLQFLKVPPIATEFFFFYLIHHIMFRPLWAILKRNIQQSFSRGTFIECQ
jgi:hypothetical protein